MTFSLRVITRSSWFFFYTDDNKMMSSKVTFKKTWKSSQDKKMKKIVDRWKKITVLNEFHVLFMFIFLQLKKKKQMTEHNCFSALVNLLLITLRTNRLKMIISTQLIRYDYGVIFIAHYSKSFCKLLEKSETIFLCFLIFLLFVRMWCIFYLRDTKLFFFYILIEFYSFFLLSKWKSLPVNSAGILQIWLSQKIPEKRERK